MNYDNAFKFECLPKIKVKLIMSDGPKVKPPVY